ncbi:MAG: ATPase, partial [Paracoccaceae bacterium]|nr:ATPase [Paracoccaceae bacterium]
MNMLPTNVFAPPPPKTLAETGLSAVMMRDLLLKAMFRMNLTQLTDISNVLCVPLPMGQELIDIARSQRLVEAMGTMSPTSSGDMAYQLTDNGKARALDALSQSEYYGALPVPLRIYRDQV